MKKKLLIISVLLFFFLSHPIRADTIIDSVYSVPELDGTILFNPEGEPELLNNFTYEMLVGDTGVPLIPASPPNSCNRSFVSFELPQIPGNCELDSVYIRLYQHQAFCNGSELGGIGFPEWNIAGGDTVKCIMSHIDYGFQLDFEDWEKGDIGNPDTFTHNIGTITDSGIDGYRYLNVTEYVLQDYDMGRILTQYRIAFEVNTDGDSLTDKLSFKTFESNNENQRPKLFFYLSNGTVIENVFVQSNSLNCKNYPNPFNPTTTLSFSLQNNSNVELSIYNIKGQKVKQLVSDIQQLSAGEHSVIWDGTDNNNKPVSSGIYLYKLRVNNKTMAARKCILLK